MKERTFFPVTLISVLVAFVFRVSLSGITGDPLYRSSRPAKARPREQVPGCGGALVFLLASHLPQS